MVTSNARGALFECNNLGCIVMMSVAICIPSPFSAPRDAMLTMFVCTNHWLSIHLYTLAYISMHESWLLVYRPYFNTMKLWTSNPNLHLSLVGTTFCLHFCLFAHLPVCFLACLFILGLAMSPAICYACHIYLACLLWTLCALSTHLFLSIVCLLVSCLCLCMYTYGTRTHGARARSP